MKKLEIKCCKNKIKDIYNLKNYLETMLNKKEVENVGKKTGNNYLKKQN